MLYQEDIQAFYGDDIDNSSGSESSSEPDETHAEIAGSTSNEQGNQARSETMSRSIFGDSRTIPAVPPTSGNATTSLTLNGIELIDLDTLASGRHHASLSHEPLRVEPEVKFEPVGNQDTCPYGYITDFVAMVTRTEEFAGTESDSVADPYADLDVSSHIKQENPRSCRIVRTKVTKVNAIDLTDDNPSGYCIVPDSVPFLHSSVREAIEIDLTGDHPVQVLSADVDMQSSLEPPIASGNGNVEMIEGGPSVSLTSLARTEPQPLSADIRQSFEGLAQPNGDTATPVQEEMRRILLKRKPHPDLEINSVNTIEDDVPGESAIMETQRALLERYKKRKAEAAAAALAGGIATVSPTSPPVQPTPCSGSLLPDPCVLAQTQRPATSDAFPTEIPEDDADEVSSDTATDGEREWEAARRKYRTLKSKETLKPRDEIEFRKAENRHKQRRRRKVAAAPEPTVIEDDGNPERGHPTSTQDTDDSAAAAVAAVMARARMHRRSQAAQKQRTKTLNKVVHNKIQTTKAERSKAAKTKKSKKVEENKSNGGNETDNRRPSKKGKGKNSRPTKPRKLSKAEKNAQDQFISIMGRLNNDTFADVEAAEAEDAGGALPNFGGGNAPNNRREHALRDLLADIPEEYKKMARKTTADLNRACKAFPRSAVKPDRIAGNWIVRGLTSRLMHHQLLGAQFMLDRENGATRPRGGILADEMGFGKTLQAISVMISARAEEKEPQCTLVVVPANLCNQWLQELKKHVDERYLGGVTVIRPGNRPHGLDVEAMLEGSFCVITTYQEIIASAREMECPNELVTDEQIVSWYMDQGRHNAGFLHRVHWHRIILDEATAIKNYRTAAARACTLLEGDRRWLLSGTPLINDVDELYSYMLWLRMPLVGSREQFLSNFKGTEQSMARMQRTLSAVMYRRTHGDRLFNKRLINLPPGSRSEIKVDFTRLERTIYDIVRLRIIDHINNKTLKNHRRGRYRQIFVLLLRLRQLTTHPMLCGETVRNILTAEDREKLRSLISETEEGAPEYSTVMHLRKVLADAAAQVREATAHPSEDTCTDVTNNGGQFGRATADGSLFLGQIERLQDSDEEPLCVVCDSLPEDPLRTSCGHLYCKECLQEHQEQEGYLGAGQARCYMCETIYDSTEKVRQDWQAPMIRKRKQVERRENKDVSWISEGDTLMPSTKLIAAKAQIQNWLNDDPESKIIVYTQWLSIVKCLERICREESWSSETYNGEMKQEHRDQAINRFSDLPDKRVLIATLKTGGMGLNLTAANRVLSLDLWFNRALENQAFCRIYRIGQQRPTELMRVMVRNTIDEDLIKMQERKMKDISKALNDDNSMKKRLTLEELMSLFGEVRIDNDNTPFVVPNPPRNSGIHRGGERGESMVFQPVDDENGLF